MRCKIRYLTRQRTGRVAQDEQIVNLEGNRITLGRGTDSTVFLRDLRVNYHHAELVVHDHEIVIEAVGHSILRIDQVPVERAVVTPDSEIEVGPYRLQLRQDEPDADLTLAVELVTPLPTDTIERLIEPRRVSLGTGILRKRAISWLLFLLVIVGGLALPVVAYRTTLPRGVVDTERTRLFAGFDRFWISGELSSSHKLLGDNCNACHELPFVPTRSEACGACHADTRHHFDVARHVFSDFAPTACTGCHNEHQGPSGIVPIQQSLCADCHSDLSVKAETELLDAADFGSAHAQFRPTVVTDPAGGRVQRVALGAAGFPEERSNLDFPHAIHLAQRCEVAGVTDLEQLKNVPVETLQGCRVLQQARQDLNQEGLGCVDCHRPEPGGVSMLLPRMERHCAVCHSHRLTFDESAPDRVLPHGKPDDVIAVINDFYAARAMQGRLAPPLEDQPGLRRRPGVSGPAAGPTGAGSSAEQEAPAIAARKLEDVFGRSLCGVCHEIIPPAASERGKWEVLPVRLTSLWMPKARFDHAAHKTMQCTDCHRAQTSRASKDVLMPPIETCRACHQGEHARAAVPSACIMCHVYHREDLDPMLPRRGQAGER
ncbi:MAG TPA: cytochrome c3 family protein [Geminicoccaceae bacterium]|nr:cytochrome c3 family protein [Geminicoccaceae bacterium]